MKQREHLAAPSRRVILHVDDLGMCHGANQAFLTLAAAGLVTCGSVMVPCPWFSAVAEAFAADGMLDIGVHLTLTAEWANYRWRPLSTSSRASGLIDDDGFFWRDVASLDRHLVPEAAEVELRAQIEAAMAAGLRPTHMDAHMAAAMLPRLLPLHVRLAEEYGLFPVLPRVLRFAPDATSYKATVAALDTAQRPVIDWFRGTLPVDAGKTASAYCSMVQQLEPGITHVALHATAPGDFAAIAPDHAGWRFREYALLEGGALDRWCRDGAIEAVGYRELQGLWNRSRSAIWRGSTPGRARPCDRASCSG